MPSKYASKFVQVSSGDNKPITDLYESMNIRVGKQDGPR